MIILLALLFLIASLIWGDWKNWRKYHATILYFILCDCLYNLLTYEYPLWSYVPNLLPTHLTNNFLIDFIAYPSAAVLFLSNFPKNSLIKQSMFFVAWLVLSLLIEWIYTFVLKLFAYDHGWNLAWSGVMDVLIFIYLKLHYEKPHVAYVLSLPAILFFLLVFRVPVLAGR